MGHLWRVNFLAAYPTYPDLDCRPNAWPTRLYFYSARLNGA